jgi:hypothetical protein
MAGSDQQWQEVVGVALTLEQMMQDEQERDVALEAL